MEIDWTQLLTWAALLTAPTPVVAGVIRQIVEVVKGLWPALDAQVSGLRISYIVAGILAALAFAFGTDHTPDAGLGAFWAFLAWATSAAGVNATIDKLQQRKSPEVTEAVDDEPAEPSDDEPGGQP